MTEPNAIPDPPSLAAGIRAGDRGQLARAITLVESSRPDHARATAELFALLPKPAEPAVRVGVTGIPGGGQEHVFERPRHQTVRGR